MNGHKPRQVLRAGGIRRNSGHQAGAFGGAGHLLHRFKGFVALHGHSLLHGMIQPSICTKKRRIMQVFQTAASAAFLYMQPDGWHKREYPIQYCILMQKIQKKFSAEQKKCFQNAGKCVAKSLLSDSGQGTFCSGKGRGPCAFRTCRTAGLPGKRSPGSTTRFAGSCRPSPARRTAGRCWSIAAAWATG